GSSRRDNLNYVASNQSVVSVIPRSGRSIANNVARSTCVNNDSQASYCLAPKLNGNDWIGGRAATIRDTTDRSDIPWHRSTKEVRHASGNISVRPIRAQSDDVAVVRLDHSILFDPVQAAWPKRQSKPITSTKIVS